LIVVSIVPPLTSASDVIVVFFPTASALPMSSLSKFAFYVEKSREARKKRGKLFSEKKSWTTRPNFFSLSRFGSAMKCASPTWYTLYIRENIKR
jgi:hypothetical protein